MYDGPRRARHRVKVPPRMCEGNGGELIVVRNFSAFYRLALGAMGAAQSP
jgi:hypothetical protein